MRLDTSNELHIHRFGNGIKLIKPNALNKTHYGWYTKHTVKNLLQMPFSIYFDNTHGAIQQLNEHNAALCGLASTNKAIGKHYFNALNTKTAQALLKNDQRVMKKEQLQIFEEEIIHRSNNNAIYQLLSIKMPWYNNQNKVIGMFGCSIILGIDSLADSLALIAKIGLITSKENLSSYIGFEKNGMYLSKQQIKCAKFLLSGMSFKEMALQMQLSPRTVECYIDNMKSKLRCRNKTELIIKLYEMYPI